MENEGKFDVAVIGAGPAGMMAAGTAAEAGAKVVLIEKNSQLGKKLILTGGGRCNLTNAEFNLRKLVENYGKDGKFLFHAFFVFGPKQVINFFENWGIKTKVEAGNRVFPINEKVVNILDAFKIYFKKNKVSVLFNSPVSRIVFKRPDASSGYPKIEKLVLGQKEIIAKKYIFCTGGISYPATGSSGDGLKWASEAGHSKAELFPALVPVKTEENWVKELQGMVLNDIKISVLKNNKKYLEETGNILFTHFGLSGPAVLNLSKDIGVLLKNGKVKLSLDLLPTMNIDVLEKNIAGKIKTNPRRSVKSLLTDFIPQRFVLVFTRNLSIDGDKQANNITREERLAIAKRLKGVEVTATELLGFEVAMVTSGGIALKEIDDKTMKSKVIDNLYFAGEIINIDGKTGGFNLQACWSTGYLAGKSAAK